LEVYLKPPEKGGFFIKTKLKQHVTNYLFFIK